MTVRTVHSCPYSPAAQSRCFRAWGVQSCMLWEFLHRIGPFKSWKNFLGLPYLQRHTLGNLGASLSKQGNSVLCLERPALGSPRVHLHKQGKLTRVLVWRQKTQEVPESLYLHAGTQARSYANLETQFGAGPGKETWGSTGPREFLAHCASMEGPMLTCISEWSMC